MVIIAQGAAAAQIVACGSELVVKCGSDKSSETSAETASMHGMKMAQAAAVDNRSEQRDPTYAINRRISVSCAVWLPLILRILRMQTLPP